ncbi:MAG: hypothetical protein SFY67_10890 [Candidatus Melainabacteria bacterium]|nr:hypothetical protein [Candidatus Melainabacteria bacterium]
MNTTDPNSSNISNSSNFSNSENLVNPENSANSLNSANSAIPFIGFPQHVHIYHHHDYSSKEDSHTKNKKSKNKEQNQDKLEDARRSITSLNTSVVSTVEALQQLLRKHISFNRNKKNSSQASNPANNQESVNWQDELPAVEDLGPPQKKIWQGLDGIGVMSFGVVIPSLMIVLMSMTCYQRITLMLLNNPLETMLELLMVAIIPIAIFNCWKFYCKNNYRFNLLRGSLLGIAIASSFFCALISTAALFVGGADFAMNTGTEFSTGFGTICMLSTAACLCAVFVGKRIRSRMEFASSRRHVLFNIVAGLVLGVLAFICAESKSWCVRLAEKAAIASDVQERKEGLGWLRLLNTEKWLKMECSDSRSIGIVGLFIPVKNSDVQKLYFTVTGKPFRDEKDENFSSMSDEYMSRHVVGERIAGLSLVRSAINGACSPDNLTSTIGWTYVFHNDTPSAKEARAEIALPPDAVITEFKVWQDGVPIEANFAATGKATNQSNNVNIGHENSGMISSLGRNRYLLHCYPVQEGKELLVQTTMVVPMNLDTLTSATLTMPRFVCSNFGLDGEHNLRLESNHKLSSKAQGLSISKSPNGSDVIEGKLQASQIEHCVIMVNAQRSASSITVAAKDPIAAAQAHQDLLAEDARKKAKLEAEIAKEIGNLDGQGLVVMIDGAHGVKQQLEDVRNVMNQRNKAIKKIQMKERMKEPRFVAQSINEVTSKAPNRVVVVLDGSQSVKAKLKEIKKAFSSIPKTVPVSVMVASQEDGLLSKPTPLAEALNVLDQVQFEGGQNNLEAVVRAAEVAGQAKGGVVLWIHGAQPALFPNIYIMSPFASKPSFYEVSLDSGETDTLEYFKNHSDISGFLPVLAGNNLTGNLRDFFLKWQPGRRDFQSELHTVSALPKKQTTSKTEVKLLLDREERELVLLNAGKTIEALIKQKRYDRAAILALQYKIVTPVSCAVILDETSAPQLQGATNGTIGPQGGDATVIMGVNTAGTVRVNNLANLEALLNIIANLMELGSIFLGGLLLLHGIFLRGRVAIMGVEISPFARISLGVVICALGLLTPGLINWFVASARDANLFS